MKENETKALELSEEELAQVSGGYCSGTANDGSCGQTVNLDGLGKCMAIKNYQCNACKYKIGASTP